MVGGIRMVAGKSGSATDVLHTAGPAPSAADLAFKPSVRYFDSAFASKMHGTSAAVAQEVG
mgnify:CR=1 FL=1